MRELEEELVHHLLRVLRRGRVAGAHPLVDVLERVLLVLDADLRVLAEGLDERAGVDGHVHHLHGADAGRRELLHHRRRAGVVAAGDHGVGVGVHRVRLHHEEAQLLVRPLLAGLERPELVEELEDVLVGPVPERTEERRREELPAAAALVHEGASSRRTSGGGGAGP